MRDLMTMMRMMVVALLLAFGAVSAAPVVAQDTTPEDGEVTTVDDEAADEADDIADETEDVADDVVSDDDEGFEWGLLGLLGLAGLAGLMRRPQPVVHDELDRSRTTARRDVIDRDNDAPRV